MGEKPENDNPEADLSATKAAEAVGVGEEQYSLGLLTELMQQIAKGEFLDEQGFQLRNSKACDDAAAFLAGRGVVLEFPPRPKFEAKDYPKVSNKHYGQVKELIKDYAYANQMDIPERVKQRLNDAFAHHIHKYGELDLLRCVNLLDPENLMRKAVSNLCHDEPDWADAINLIMLAWYVANIRWRTERTK